mgnify:CR=1 FL=1
MTTFDQALANLQNSNNQRAALAKGYNNDVAEFQTRKAKDTARLFMLAGEIGKDISTRLAERKEKEEKYENLYQVFEDKYLGNFEVDPKFKQEIITTEFGQNQASTILSDSVTKGKLSAYVGTEGIKETGIGDRATTAALVHGKSLEFTPWYYNQIRNNTGSFTAYLIDPTTKQLTSQLININASNLNRDQQNARLQYLTKQFVAQTAGEYDPKFLTYDQKDGGSGYAMSIMTQNDTLKKEIEKNIVSQSGINARNQAAHILYNTEDWNEATLQTAVNLVLNSSNVEGTGIMRRDKAWKAFHKLLKEGAETGNITRDELTKIVNLEILNINGNKTLAQHRPDLYGDSENIKGTVFEEVDTYTKNLNSMVDNRNKAVQLEMAKGWKQEIANGVKTWDHPDIQAKVEEWNITDPDFDSFAFNNELKGVPTEASIATANEIWDRYEKKEIGDKRLLNDYILGHPLEQALRNDPKIAKQLELEQNIETILKDDLKNLEISVSKTTREQLGLTGKASWPDATTGADYWKLVKAEAVHRYLDSQQKGLGKSPNDIINEVKAEIAAVPELDAPYKDHLIRRGKEKNEYGEYNIDDEYAKEDWSLHDNSYHAKDLNGVYYNVYKDSKLLSPTWYADSIKNKEKETLPNINLKDPTAKIPAEQKWINKYPAKNGEAVDWNEYVVNEGITSDINEVCKAQNKSALECIQERASASGQTLNEDVIEKLSGDVLNNVDSKTKKKIENGEELTNGDNINITKSTNSAGIHNNLNGGEDGEKITNSISTHWCNECIDDNGKWKAGSEEYGKLNLGLGMGLLKSLNDTAAKDFTLDGADTFFEATKDIPKEELLESVYSNPTAAFEAAKHSGDINYLPKEDFSILDDKKQTDYFKILDVLAFSLDNTQGNPYTTD